MAYGDNTLNADHQWTFNNVLTDNIGSLTLSNTGGTFVTTPITRDSTHSYQTNGRDDLAVVATTTDTGSVGFSQYAVGGWFMVSQIQGPPCMIYKQGGNTAGFTIFLWAGNNVMMQTKYNTPATTLQTFSDSTLTNNRPYHFLIKVSGSGFDGDVKFYIDGVEQTSTKDGNTIPLSTFTAHTGNHNWGENGSTGTEVSVGNEIVLVKAPVNGFFSQWWTWEGTDAALTDAEITNDIFGAGAIPDVTITSDTQANMQTQLDALASSARPDVPLCILVEAVTGDGDLTLTADNITFDERASIHVRYEGNGKLTWINENGSNASIGSTVNQDIDFVEAVPVTITVLNINDNTPIQNARVYITLNSNSQVIANDVTNASGQLTVNFNYLEDEPISGWARQGTSSTYYKEGKIGGTIGASGFSQTVLMIPDE